MSADLYQFPMSFAQQRLWILDHLTPGTAFYNLSAPIRLAFAVNSLILSKSVDEMVRRHEILRTTFKEVNGEPCQEVASSLHLDLGYHDLLPLASTTREDTLRQLMSHEARQPFDLQRGPLVRVSLYRLQEREYIFQVTMHHIIADAWSQVVFIRELTTIYEAFAVGKPVMLPELPIQYADYAVWQREHMQGEVLNEHLAYWKHQLVDLQTLELPLDHKRPAIQSYRGNIEYVAIPASLTTALKAFSQRQSATLFMTLLAAFAVLLHRYSAQEDIAIGAPVVGRGQTEVENLVGFFINSLVIRINLYGNPPFTELLQRVKKTSLDAVGHGELPFEKLVEELHPDRDLGRNPLFQVSFQLMQFPPLGNAEASTNGQAFGFDKGTSIFDLRVTLTEENGMITGELEYSTDLFEQSTIQRLLRHYETLLSDILAHPSGRLSDLRIIPLPEWEQIIRQWNTTKENFGENNILHRLFEQQAARTPLRPAVLFGSMTINYAELNARANRLARHLQHNGIGRDGIVGVYLERSEMMIVAFLAVLKAGAAYVPLDPSYPADRTAMIVADAGVRVMISQRSLADSIGLMNTKLILPDEEWPSIAVHAAGDLQLPMHSLDIAYVIYTSGSTGKPKGVPIPHAAICNHMLWMKKYFPLGENETVIQRTPYSFDASVWEFYAPLINGARLLIAEEGGAKDPEYLIETITRHSVTVLQLVPSLLQALLAHPQLGSCTSLRQVFCGGEALAPALIRSFYETLNATLYNLYGPTEATIDASCWHCQVEPGKEHAAIGKPVSNGYAYVLDAFGNVVPAGVPGELWIAGEGLARGYLHRPALTADRFMPDPFSDQPGARMYRTGDKAKWRKDGTLEYIERIDQQIKLRGYRIEPGEIELALQTHPQVRQVVVTTQPDINGQERLVAYIVAAGTNDHDDAVLKKYLQDKLPDFMIPSHVIFLDRIPLKTNGKLDRQSLPVINAMQVRSDPDFEPPGNAQEQVIADIWSEVLGVQRIGVHENFFRDLGGNSLLAIQVMSRVRKAFGVQLSLQTIFTGPTVRAFAQQLKMPAAPQPELIA